MVLFGGGYRTFTGEAVVEEVQTLRFIATFTVQAFRVVKYYQPPSCSAHRLPRLSPSGELLRDLEDGQTLPGLLFVTVFYHSTGK